MPVLKHSFRPCAYQFAREAAIKGDDQRIRAQFALDIAHADHHWMGADAATQMDNRFDVWRCDWRLNNQDAVEVRFGAPCRCEQA